MSDHFNLPGFHAVLQKSRLTQEELAQIYNVSRQTISAWNKGKVPRPDTWNAFAAKSITSRLSFAMTRGVLPLKTNLSAEERAGQVTKMAETLKEKLKS